MQIPWERRLAAIAALKPRQRLIEGPIAAGAPLLRVTATSVAPRRDDLGKRAADPAQAAFALNCPTVFSSWAVARPVSSALRAEATVASRIASTASEIEPMRSP